MVWGSFPFYTEDEICFEEVNLDFDITPECKDIIRKCLKKCPKERPSLLQLFDTPFIKQTKLNEGSEDLTNIPVSASSNSFSASKLSSEDSTNLSNSGISASLNSFMTYRYVHQTHSPSLPIHDVFLFLNAKPSGGDDIMKLPGVG